MVNFSLQNIFFIYLVLHKTRFYTIQADIGSSYLISAIAIYLYIYKDVDANEKVEVEEEKSEEPVNTTYACLN